MSHPKLYRWSLFHCCQMIVNLTFFPPMPPRFRPRPTLAQIPSFSSFPSVGRKSNPSSCPSGLWRVSPWQLYPTRDICQQNRSFTNSFWFRAFGLSLAFALSFNPIVLRPLPGLKARHSIKLQTGRFTEKLDSKPLLFIGSGTNSTSGMTAYHSRNGSRPQYIIQSLNNDYSINRIGLRLSIPLPQPRIPRL